MDLSNENIIHIKKNGIEYLQFKKLLDYQNIINHAYGIGINRNYRTARANNQTLENNSYQKAIEDYQTLCQAIGTKAENLVKPIQNHTDKIEIVTQKINPKEPDFNLQQYTQTDGLVTKEKNIILTTTNADCILLLFFDPVQKVIANTHSGWRGTLQKIGIKTIKKMKNEFQSKPENIICCICPSIRKCHFEVEKEVKEEFEKEFQNIDGIIEETIPNKKWKIDTVKINKTLLEKEGLKPENIIDSGICSVCHSDQIHSYRAEKQGYGLNAALIEMKQ